MQRSARPLPLFYAVNRVIGRFGLEIVTFTADIKVEFNFTEKETS